MPRSGLLPADPIAGPRLSISILGAVRITVGGREVRIRGRKSRAVLAYLALCDNYQETRERLVGLLWSEFEEDKARASLRQVLHELRETLTRAGYHGLRAERLTVGLDPDSVGLDLAQVEQAAAARQAHALLMGRTRVIETLLQDMEDLDEAFRVWLMAKRQTIHDRLVRLLEAGLTDTAVQRPNRRDLAQALMSLDPTHEAAGRFLMRFYAEEGDTGSALRIYNTLYQVLGDDYDMEPSQPTQQLVAEIKQGLIEPDAPSADPAPDIAATGIAQVLVQPRPGTDTSPPSQATTRMALVVEPFGINGVGPDQTHLVEGFRHHLIACLVRFREWYVTETGTPRNHPTGPPPISAQYAIAATAYQAGNAINLVLTLREYGSSLYVWSDAFELNLDNWFEAQQRIVGRIARSLNVQLSIERLMRLAHEPDVSLAVYDKWLRGQAMITRFSPQNWNRAAQIFAESIEEAPAFAPAYSSLAQMNNALHIVHPGMPRAPEKAARTVELARKAVALDPIDSRSQLCLGWALTMACQYQQAATHMQLARELNPYDSWTLISVALYRSFCGDRDAARSLTAEALEQTLAPNLIHWAYEVTIRFMAGDYDAMLLAADRSQNCIPTIPGWRAAALALLGRTAEARESADVFLRMVRGNWFGNDPPEPPAITRWYLNAFPIARKADWDRLRDGIAGAGLPVGGITYDPNSL
jgi:DNA-binding SARP family transcriptional activator/TolB-like protein